MERAGVPLTANQDEEGAPMSISDAIALSMMQSETNEDEELDQTDTVRSKAPSCPK